MINLSSAQSAVVTAPIGLPLQVLASAGSGKTRVLTERIRHILENSRNDGIIALTFTNKAAEEMRARLDGIEDIEERCWIGTIHTVAQRILNQYGHTIGLPSELHIYERDQDRKTVFLQSLRENGTDIDAILNIPNEQDKKEREKIIQNYLDQFAMVKRNLLTEADTAEQNIDSDFWGLYQAYQDALLQGGGVDFDDILVYAHRILLQQPWCGQIYRAKYKHLCVDEAQDLNKAQYEFIKALCADELKSVMMVGDPNQMIYGFNGSSARFLCTEFFSDFKPQPHVLKENYRSSQVVIHLANKLKPGSQIQTEKDFALPGRCVLKEVQDEDAEAEWICGQIRTLLDEKVSSEIEGEIALTNMVVIARNRFVFRALEEKLIEHHTPFSLKKGERQVEPSSLFGRVLDLAIRLKLNPKDWVDGKKLCEALKISPPAFWGGDGLLKQFANLAKSADVLFPEIQANLLDAIHQLDLEQPNIPKLVADFTSSIQALVATPDLDKASELERSLQELVDFQKSWTAFRLKGLGDSLSAFRNAMALGQLAEDFNPVGLTLSTVHTMKGLEKDIVFLMGMCEGVFPDYRARSMKELDEELNSAFVAVTRSRRWIYITYPKRRKMPWGDVKDQTPSRYFVKMK
jgi:DNA helicase-2/ATP-dependent DNA helicase PcrA